MCILVAICFRSRQVAGHLCRNPRENSRPAPTLNFLGDINSIKVRNFVAVGLQGDLGSEAPSRIFRIREKKFSGIRSRKLLDRICGIAATLKPLLMVVSCPWTRTVARSCPAFPAVKPSVGAVWVTPRKLTFPLDSSFPKKLHYK